MKIRILTIILLASVLIIATGCKKTDYGDINKVDIESSYGTETTLPDGSAPKDYFNDYEEKLGYEYKEYDIGMAQLQIPYPATWKAEKTSDYNLWFQAPDNDPHFPGERIYFHSTFQTEDIYDHTTVLPEFDLWSYTEKYPVNGRQYQIMANTDPEKTVVNESIVDPNLQFELSYRDWDVKSQPRSSGLYRQATTFYWLNKPCILSGMTTNEHADEMNDLLLYMMSHSKYINHYFESVEKIHIMEGTSDIEFKLCPIFRQSGGPLSNLDGYYSNIDQFDCPADSGTGFSQISLSFYEVRKDKWKGIKDEDDFNAYLFEPLMRNTFGEKVYRKADFAGRYEKTGGHMEFSDRNAEENIYWFTLHRYNGDMYFDGQEWVTVFWPIENGDYVDIMAITGRQASLPWMTEVADFAAISMHFGGDKK